MKRIAVLLSSCVLAVSAAFAQEGTTEKLYPSAGALGVGIEASPILDFVGNMFNGNTDNASDSRWSKQDYTLHGRYFLTDDDAVRVHLRFNPGDNKTIERRFITDQAARTINPLSNDKVEDKRVSWKNDWRISAGYQHFRGTGRLRGFFGGDVFYRYFKESKEFYYGNKMNEFNASPLSAKWGGSGEESMATRPISEYGSGNHSLGLVAFTGAEYYFYQNMSLGFEVGLAIQGSFGTRSKITSEKMVGTQHTTIENEGAPDKSTFHIGTNPGKKGKGLGAPMGNGGLAGTGYGNFYFIFHF